MGDYIYEEFMQPQNLNKGKIPMFAEQKKNLGNELYKSQNYELALEAYTDAIALRPDMAKYYGNRAACYMMLSDYTNALHDSRMAVELDPTFERAYVRMAKCYLAQGDIISAEKAIQKVEELDAQVDAADAEKQLCQQLRQLEQTIQGHFDKQRFCSAMYFLELAMLLAPDSWRYRLMKAECLALLGRCDDAVDITVSAMKLDNTSVDALYVRGICFAYTDDLDKGIKYFELALQFDPTHSKAKEMRIKCKILKELKDNGNTLFRLKRYREAEALYTEALKIDEYNLDINSKLLYNRALVYSKLNNLRETVTGCTQALAINNKYLKALLLRARCYNLMEKYDECCNDYEAALKIEKSPEIKKLLRDVKLATDKTKRKDYFKILGVSRNAGDEEIKKAYRKKALDHHPDRHSNSSPHELKAQELQFKEIGEAYAILSDQRKKQQYANSQTRNVATETYDFDPNKMFRCPTFAGTPRGTGQFRFQF